MKSENPRAIELEKEFSALRYEKTTALISWKQLVANTYSGFKAEESLVGVVFINTFCSIF